MAGQPPFNMLRAAFFLLAIMILLEMLATIFGGVLCWWINATSVREPGACAMVTNQIREVWTELLTAVLALLLAGRTGNGPPPGNKE